jgi:DNA-binding transcriptional ArsR family regulator
MTKSAISHQLKSLRLSNLVKYDKQGKVVYYSLADSHVKDILEKGFEHVTDNEIDIWAKGLCDSNENEVIEIIKT